jgi:AcrR family transcriptional regulator
MTDRNATRTKPACLDARKLPQQPRAYATVEAILEAAARILEHDSAAEFTTNHVAELAGVGIGSLYQYFPNKAALVAALLEREHILLAESIEQLVVALATMTLDESLAAMAHFAVAQQFDRPRLSAILDQQEQMLPVADMLARVDARILAGVERLIERHRGALPTNLGPNTARDCLSIARAIVESDMGATSPPPDLEERVLRALTGYLTVTSIRKERVAPGAMLLTPGLSRKSPE